MADPVRLFAEFKDDQGDAWRVNVHDVDFVGTATEFTLAADGFVLTYEGNSEDRHQPIIGSQVQFTIMDRTAQTSSFLDHLPGAVEGRFSVSVREDPDGTDLFFWGGIILPEQVVRADTFDPRPVDITATDDLGN